MFSMIERVKKDLTPNDAVSRSKTHHAKRNPVQKGVSTTMRILMIALFYFQRISHGFTTPQTSIFWTRKGKYRNNHRRPYATRSSNSMSSALASSSDNSVVSKNMLRFVDIGANLMDDRYVKGEYFGKVRHEPDFDAVLERSAACGVTHLILTAGTLEESRQALQVVREYRADKMKSVDGLYLFCTVGVHPTRCQQEFVENVSQSQDKTADDVLQELLLVAQDGVRDGCVVALGEIGLDYDRLQFSPKDVQQEFLKRQLDLFWEGSGDNEVSSLPLFLHNRSVGRDLLLELKVQNEKRRQLLKGVIHSFDDTVELAEEFINLGLFIGLNGCSLKTDENLQVVRALPLTSILLETDCPYCEIKPTHAGFRYVKTSFEKKAEKKFVPGFGVKGRNEPNQIVQVAEVIAGVKGIAVEEVATVCYANSVALYGFGSSVHHRAR